MTVFTYKAKSKAGDTAQGEMEAANAQAVQSHLAGMGLVDIKVRKKPQEINIKMPGTSGVTNADLMVFTRQFSTMIDAGLPLVQCLEILSSQQENYWFKKVLNEVQDEVKSGKTFADALGKHPKVFDNLFVNLVAAGETGGILDTIMNRLANQIEKAEKLRKKVKSAMFYPATIMLVAFAAVVVLLLFVIPQFEKMFADFDAELPGPTQFVISMSNWSIEHWYYYVIIPVILFTIWKVIRHYKTSRRLSDKLFLILPIAGPLIRKTAVAQFTRTMGTMLSSGVPILDGLEIVARASGNTMVSEGIMYARLKVSEGKNLSEPLGQLGIFPSMVCQMVSIGEQTGALDTMLTKIADFYEEEVDAAVAGLTQLLEPLIMVFLAVVIGGFLVAMYLPIFTIAGSVG
jgi:type IV pilus assembly protein PilC